MKVLVAGLLLQTGLFAAAKDEFVNVSGKGSIKVFPDQVILSFGVSKIDKKVDSAVGATSRVANKLTSICKAYGIKDKEIETQSNSLERAYKTNHDTTTYLGIKSEVIYDVTLSKVDSVNALLNALYRNGMNEFRGFVFGHTRQDSLKRAASRLAIRDAFENASVLAETSGRKIKTLSNASYEKPEDFSFRPQTRHEGFWSGAQAGMGEISVDRGFDLEYFKIRPGFLVFEIEVFAKYELK